MVVEIADMPAEPGEQSISGKFAPINKASVALGVLRSSPVLANVDRRACE